MYSDAGNERTAYAPPKSTSYGHAARKRDPRQALAELEHFLETHCVWSLRELVQLRAGVFPDPSPRSEAVSAARAEAIARFGSKPIQPGLWYLKPADRNGAVDFVLEVNSRWTSEPHPPASVHFSYDLVWKHLVHPSASAGEIPWATDGSRLGTGLGFTARTVFFTPSFVFPFPHDAPALYSFLAELERDLPFRLRDQYFKRLLRDRAGGWSQVQRLGKGWRRA